MTEYVWAAWAGFVLDFIIGDPPNWWHPVRSIGWLITVLEKPLRSCFPDSETGQCRAGISLVCCVIGATILTAAGIVRLSFLIHPVLGYFVSSVMSWQILAARSLKTESMKVYYALKASDVEAARRAVSMIVGRDTAVLDEAGITRAAVETVAENTSDGVIAPLLWLLLFGPLGGFFYKAVNTMDSMVGYRNERFLYYGRAAAHLDDLVNYIPARLTAILIVFAAWILPGMDGRQAWRIWRRDRRCHKSPNSAQGESACAGALGLQLAGDAWYFGELHHKPAIGDSQRPIVPEDIARVNRLMYTASITALLAGTGGILWMTISMAAIFTAI